MTKRSPNITRLSLATISVLTTVFCLASYWADIYWGDGDGIIEQYKLNPITLFIVIQLFVLPLIGTTLKPRWILNSSLVFFSVLITLLVAEWAVTLLFPKLAQSHNQIENIGPTPVFTKMDTIFFKNYHPGAQFNTHIQEADSSYSVLNNINQLGIRGSEIALRRQGEKRILLLGDSYLQSDEVAFDATVGARLEAMLPDSFTVFQHGNPSWSPLLELNWLLHRGLDLDIDQLVLFVYYNDFFPGTTVGDEGYTPFARFDSLGYPRSFEFQDLPEGNKRRAWTQFKMQLTNINLMKLLRVRLQRDRLQRSVKAFPIEELLQMEADHFSRLNDKVTNSGDLLRLKFWSLTGLMRDTALWDSATRERLQLSAGYLEQMHRLLVSREIDFKLCLIASPWQFNGENRGTRKFFGLENQSFPRGGLEDYWAAFCREREIPFISLFSAFADQKARSDIPLYFMHDGHWTPAGHDLVAHALLPIVQPETENPEDAE